MAISNDAQQQKEVFERSYGEVLSALKHQDDKLNRTLTALAFLTVAGVSLFAKLDGQDGGGLGASGATATDVLFVSFLIAVAMGVIVSLTAIGPGSPLKRRRPNTERSKRDPSLIFYARIAYDSDWGKYRHQSPNALVKRLTDNLHDEAKLIAQRTQYKVTRSREASAWVQFAIVSLALMGISSATGMQPAARWWIAFGLLAVALILPFWDLVLMVETRYISDDYSTLAYCILTAIVVIALTLLVLGQVLGSVWAPLAYAAVAFVVPRYAVVRPKFAMPLLTVGVIAGIPALLLMLLV